MRRGAWLLMIVGIVAMLTTLSAGPAMAARHGHNHVGNSGGAQIHHINGKNHRVVVLSRGFNNDLLDRGAFFLSPNNLGSVPLTTGLVSNPTNNTVVVSPNNARFGCTNGTNFLGNLVAQAANILMQQSYVCTGS